MKKNMVVAALCAGAVLCAPFAHAQSIGDVDKKVREAWGKLKSFSGVIKVDGLVSLSPPGAPVNPKAAKLPVTGAGTVQYLKDGDKGKYRQTIDVKALGIAAAVDAVFDGDKLHLKTNLQGTVKVQEASPSIDKGLVPPGGGALLDEVQKHIDLTPKPDGQLNGRPVFVLEGKLKPGEKLMVPIASVNVSLDKETGALAQLEFIGVDPTAKVTLSVNDIKVNPEIKPETFAAPTTNVEVKPVAPGAAPAAAGAAPAAAAAPAPAAAPAAAPAPAPKK